MVVEEDHLASAKAWMVSAQARALQEVVECEHVVCGCAHDCVDYDCEVYVCGILVGDSQR
jgi:hypothetical protein